jgi:hypothetical protein
VADEQTRRRWNQDFFTKLFIRDDEVVAAELTDDLRRAVLRETRHRAAYPRCRASPQATHELTSLRAWGFD